MIDKKNRDVIKEIIKPEYKLVTYLYVYALVAGIINLALPLGIQAIISFLTYGQLSTSWWVLVSIVTFTVALSGIFKIKQMTVSEKLQQKLFARIANDIIKKLPNIDSTKLNKNYLPEIVNRFFDVIVVQKSLSKILLDLSTDSLTIILGIIVLSFYHPFFAFFGLFLLIFLLIIIKYTGKKGLETSIVESDYKYEVLNWIEEIARNYIPFKYNKIKSIDHSNSESNTSLYVKFRRKHFNVLLVQFSLLVLFKVLIIAFLLGFGSYLVLKGILNIGQFVASELIIIMVVNSIEKIIQNIEAIYDTIVSFFKISKVYLLSDESSNGISSIKTVNDIKLQIKNLTLVSKRSESTLEDFEANPGDIISIEGDGKSNRNEFVEILAGLNHDYKGQIKINNIELKALDKKEVYKFINYVDFSEGVYKSELNEYLELDNERIVNLDLSLVSDQIETKGIGLTTFEKHNLLLQKALNTDKKLLVLDISSIDLTSEESSDFINNLKIAEDLIIFLKTNNKEIAKDCNINIIFNSENNGSVSIKQN